VAGPGRQRAGAEVAPGRQRHGHGGERRGAAGGQRQQPPALATVGADPLDPANRRQPPQPRQAAVGLAARVARDPQQPGRAQDANGDAPGAAGAGGQLGRHGADRREHEAGGGELQAESQRPGSGQPLADHAQRHQRGQDQVGPEGHQQRRRQARVPADHGRTDQLAAPGLLLDPGVPDDGE
jgi:hypothetical protein